MTLNQLLYFQTTAKLQHFRQAATALNISQPSLSRSISTLEEELGIILFERNGRNIRLTKYGRIFLEHVDRIMNEVQTAENHMRQLAGDEGDIDIAYVFPLASHYIPHMVRRFLSQEKNRHVNFNFHQLHTSEIIDGLKKEKYDIAFCSYVENEPDIQFTPLIHQEMVVITPPGHPLTSRTSLSLQDMMPYPMIGYDRHSGLGRFTRRCYESYGLSATIRHECPDENAISALVSEDFGIALVADVEAVHDRNVEILHLEGSPIQHTVYLAYMKDRYLIPSAKNFIKFIRKEGSQL